MSNTTEASSLHKQDTDHQEAAKNHLKAADSHEKNKVSEAKESSKNAMGCCATAQKSTEKACHSSSM
ncbi:hypothetical protein QN372_20645 [Undibacterium sp. RTI2.1]|uniref:hypothetical protein n=1 Tax=Undibacterium sp. RTI2.1 TaxID=3048637 RepID=UPI002B233D18|nr:hypothetical protein [Undibacterium sp. RTI2.1]MEB0033152.1 hypothetical protein [Undibacterium sp. RTI2.1]